MSRIAVHTGLPQQSATWVMERACGHPQVFLYFCILPFPFLPTFIFFCPFSLLLALRQRPDGLQSIGRRLVAASAPTRGAVRRRRLRWCCLWCGFSYPLQSWTERCVLAECAVTVGLDPVNSASAKRHIRQASFPFHYPYVLFPIHLSCHWWYPWIKWLLQECTDNIVEVFLSRHLSQRHPYNVDRITLRFKKYRSNICYPTSYCLEKVGQLFGIISFSSWHPRHTLRSEDMIHDSLPQLWSYNSAFSGHTAA
jgi:hypothetical protein